MKSKPMRIPRDILMVLLIPYIYICCTINIKRLWSSLDIRWISLLTVSPTCQKPPNCNLELWSPYFENLYQYIGILWLILQKFASTRIKFFLKRKLHRHKLFFSRNPLYAFFFFFEQYFFHCAVIQEKLKLLPNDHELCTILEVHLFEQFFFF